MFFYFFVGRTKEFLTKNVRQNNVHTDFSGEKFVYKGKLQYIQKQCFFSRYTQTFKMFVIYNCKFAKMFV